MSSAVSGVPSIPPSVAPEINELRVALEAFHEASDRSSTILVRLTWVLVFLTLAILALTVVVAING